MSIVKTLGFTFGGIALVAAAAVGGALWYVQSHDMAPLVRWAAARQNLPVQVAGPVRLRLSGGPEVQLAGLTIPAYHGTNPLLTVGRAKVKLAWGNGLFFWHNMHLLEAGAENPTLTLVKDKTGFANWQNPATSTGTPQTTGEDEATSGADGLEALLAMLTEARLSIRNLNATYADATTGRAVTVKGMDILASTNGTQAATTLKGTINEAPLEGTLTVDIADLNTIPLTFNLTAAGLKAAATGTVSKQSHFAGKVDVQTANLKQTLATLLGKAPDQAPAAEFRMVGDVAAGTEAIALHAFTTRMGDLLQINGDATATLTGTPSANGTLHVESSNLRQLAGLLQGKVNPAIPALPATLDTTLSGQNTITIKEATFRLGTLLTLAAKADITPGSTPSQPTVNGTATLSVANLQNLGKALGQATPLPAQPLNAHLTLSAKGGTYTLTDTTAQIGSLLTAEAKGRVATASGTPEVAGTLSLQGADIKTTAAGFGVAAAALPSSPFRVGATVSGEGTFALKDVVLNLPQLLEATANLSVTPGKPLNINGTVDVQRFNATALGYCKAGAPAVNTAAPTGAGTAATGGDAPWSDTPLNFSALQSIAVNLKLTVKGIACASVPVTAAQATITNTPSQLDVKGLTLSLPQGSTATADLKLEHAGTPVLALTAGTTAVPVEELVPTLKAKGVRLPLTTRTVLNSQGRTTRMLAQNLGGTLSLEATQGQLPYTSLLGNVMAIQKLISVGTSASALPSNGDGTVDSLKGAFTIKNGVASTDELKVSTGNGAMTLTGTGTVDLAGWALNYTLTPTLHGSSDMAIPVLLKGPLTSPGIGADPDFVSKLSGRLATQTVGKALGKALGVDKEGQKGIGAAVGNIISGKGVSSENMGQLLTTFTKKKEANTPAPTTDGTPTEPTNPQNEAVKNLLQGILAK